jgi:hypothetical protein
VIVHIVRFDSDSDSDSESESVVVAVEYVGLHVQVGVSPTGTDLVVAVEEEHNCPSDQRSVSPVGLGLGSVLVADVGCILTGPAAVVVLVGTGPQLVAGLYVDVAAAVLVGIVEHDELVLVGFDVVMVPVGAVPVVAVVADIAVVPVDTESVPVVVGTAADGLLVAVHSMTVLPE